MADKTSMEFASNAHQGEGFPISSIDGILVNDLTGRKVFPSPVVMENSISDVCLSGSAVAHPPEKYILLVVFWRCSTLT